jgi:hypothetical protein
VQRLPFLEASGAALRGLFTGPPSPSLAALQVAIIFNFRPSHIPAFSKLKPHHPSPGVLSESTWSRTLRFCGPSRCTLRFFPALSSPRARAGQQIWVDAPISNLAGIRAQNGSLLYGSKLAYSKILLSRSTSPPTDPQSSRF